MLRPDGPLGLYADFTYYGVEMLWSFGQGFQKFIPLIGVITM